MSNELQTQMASILERDIVRRPSFFQLKYFILGKEPTVQAKLWCCIRELRNRKESMEAMAMEIDETLDNRELLQLKIDKLSSLQSADPHEQAETEIMVRKHRRQMVALDKSLASLRNTLEETGQEAEFLVRAFEVLSQEEELKPFDDLESQTAFWNARFAQKIDLAMLLQRPLDPELVREVLLLDDAVPVKKKVVNLLECLHQQMLTRVAPPSIRFEPPEETKQCPNESRA